MSLHLLSTALVSLGVLTLCASLRPAWKLHAQANNEGWHVLFGLVVLFIGGYSACLYRIVLSESVSPIGAGFSIILFAGSIFVFLVVSLFLRSLRKLKKVAEDCQYALGHDPVTGLPNRNAMIEELTEEVTASSSITLFIVDIVKFKQVNDSLGNYYGDKLLSHVANLLSERFGAMATVSRFGGDEFALMLKDASEAQVKDVASQLTRFLSCPIQFDDYQINSSVAVGYCSFPAQANTVDQLIEFSSLAVFESKRQDNMSVEYSDSLVTEGDKHPNLINMMMDDLTRDRFEVHYQPIVDAKEQRVTAVEALTRWPKADGGFVPPNLFIPLAEQENKISDLTVWLIGRIARDIPQLVASGEVTCVHMNLSAKDLMNSRVQALLEYHAVQTPNFAEVVCLEITESAAFEENDTTYETIQKLKEIGYRLSLDDFGTGYSSLSLLRKLPIHQVKLDRSFVSNISKNNNDHSIVKTMIELSHTLGYSVVAEGVENQEVAIELERLGCDFLQGYLFSPAVPLTSLSTSMIQKPKLVVVA